MLLSLQSTRPQYNHIQTNIQIPWNCEYIKYYVESVNIDSLWVTTDEDFIEYSYDDDEGNPTKLVINFTYAHHYDTNALMVKLEFDNNERRQQIVDVDYNNDNNKLVSFTPLRNNFKITQMTHRAGLVTGLYNIKLNEVLPKDVEIIGEKSVQNYYNKLYLVSKQGQSIKSNIGDREYNPSIIANIDHIIRGSTPIIANFEFLGKPIKNIVNIDSFKQIELELVDFQYQPVPLTSPMFVTMKVKPCENPHMRLSE